MTRTKIAGLAVSMLVFIAAVVGVVLWQVGNAEAKDTGSCDGATFVLESEAEDNATEVSFEVQSGSPGQIWQVEILQGDDSLVEGTRTTDEDAEIDVDAYAIEGASGDITATATFEGQTCTASLPAN